MSTQKYFFVESLGNLYYDVQSSHVFADSKLFVDCVPNSSPEVIAAAYEQEKQQPGFNLEKFVKHHFTLPVETAAEYHSANKPIEQHLDELWEVLKRTPDHNQAGTLLPLPFAYIVPGGRFREVYYWDSYFTMLGLQVTKRVDIIQNMVDNFAYLIDEVGLIPNGNRSYYLGRSQPPFFALMVEVLAEEKGETILLKYLPQLEKEYAFWMMGADELTSAKNNVHRVVEMSDGSVLNRYWDENETARPEAYAEDKKIAEHADKPAQQAHRHIRAACESGWDFSSRWFSDGVHITTIEAANIIPVDLNCLLLHLEQTLLKIYTINNNLSHQSLFTSAIQNRSLAIQKYCWNEAGAFYYDYNFIATSVTGKQTLAAVYPLFFKLATQHQAQEVANIIEAKFLGPGGLLTTLVNTGQQWDAPNGWAPLQWMAYKGLMQYGFTKLAGEIKQRWTQHCEKVYAETGKMMEKYNVTDTHTKAGGGEYPNQDGFGWTNGVYLKMKAE